MGEVGLKIDNAFVLGMRFALFQIKVGLIELLRDYHFVVNSKTKLPVELNTKGIFLAPKHKIWLDITKADI